MDLRKAFDVVNHDIPMTKLDHYGIANIENNWFGSYLSEIQHFIEVRGTKSNKETVICGVPQGSVLAPPLFPIFINDMETASHKTKPVLLSDDTTLVFEAENIENLYFKISQEMSKLEVWFAANELPFHPDKTKYILFHPPKNFQGKDIMLMGRKTSRISGDNSEEKSFKFVGVRIDDKLEFDHHIKAIHDKNNNGIVLICRARKSLPKNVKSMLYNAIIGPYIEYAIAIWGATKTKLIKPLVIKQKKMITIANVLPMRYPASQIYQNTKIPAFTNLLKLNQLKVAHSLWWCHAPAHLWISIE